MPKQVLFIQGAGTGAYEADKKLVESLRRALGAEYQISYPTMPHEENAQYDSWQQKISQELAKLQGAAILIGHSVGASILLKSLGTMKAKSPITGIFLLATPFWGGDGWRYEGYEKLELTKNLTAKLPQDMPIFLYHCQDDDIVPYEHLALYMQLLPHATSYPVNKGGHQFNNDLTLVAKKIRSANLASY